MGITFFGICQTTHLPLKKQVENKPKMPMSVALAIGMSGAGIEFGRSLSASNRLFLKAGLSYIGYNKLYNFEYNPKSTIKIDPDVRHGQAYAGINYFPFKKSTFYLTSGIGYLYSSKLKAVINTETGFVISDTEIAAEDFGKINIELQWNKITPFVGLGFGRTVPKSRIGVGAEIGVYYLGSPQIHLDYTGILEITNIDEVLPKIQDNMKGYAYLPALNFKIRYRI